MAITGHLLSLSLVVSTPVLYIYYKLAFVVEMTIAGHSHLALPTRS
jgi:hypothetical protein